MILRRCFDYRDGDMYAALRDCHTALKLDLNHLKAHFRLAKCLNELSWSKEAFECLSHFKNKFPDYASSRACEQLDKDIRAAIFARTESGLYIFLLSAFYMVCFTYLLCGSQLSCNILHSEIQFDVEKLHLRFSSVLWGILICWGIFLISSI